MAARRGVLPAADDERAVWTPQPRRCRHWVAERTEALALAAFLVGLLVVAGAVLAGVLLGARGRTGPALHRPPAGEHHRDREGVGARGQPAALSALPPGRLALPAPAENASDARIVDWREDACQSPYEWANGRWLQAAEPGDARSFGPAGRSSELLLADIRDLELARSWDKGLLGRFFYACLAAEDASGPEADARERDRLLDGALSRLHAPGVERGVALARTFGYLGQRGFIVPLYVSVQRNPVARRQPMLYVQQDGLLGLSTGASAEQHQEHRRLLQALLLHDPDPLSKRPQALERLLGLETQLAAAHRGSWARTLNEYALGGELASDTMSGAALAAELAGALDWSEFLCALSPLRPAAATAWAERAAALPHWVYRPPYLATLGRLLRTLPLRDWELYVRASVALHSFQYLPRLYTTLRVRDASLVPTGGGGGGGRTRDPSVGLHDAHLLPWHPARRRQWAHKQQLSQPQDPGPALEPNQLPADPASHICTQRTLQYLPERFDHWFAKQRLTPEIVDQVHELHAGNVAQMRHRLRHQPDAVREPALRKLALLDLQIGPSAEVQGSFAAFARDCLPGAPGDRTEAALLGSVQLQNVLQLRRLDAYRRLFLPAVAAAATGSAPTAAAAAAASAPSLELFGTSAVNAYYSPPDNRIMVLCGILQAPFYAPVYSTQSQRAALGLVLAHELGHAFDPNGVQFDADGSLRPWLPDTAAARYAAQMECVSLLYDGRTRYGVWNDGWRSLGENAADLLGLQLTLGALQAAAGPESLDAGVLSEFFLVYAQLWAARTTATAQRHQLSTDVHSAPELRVARVLMQQPAYRVLHGCAAPPRECRVW